MRSPRFLIVLQFAQSILNSSQVTSGLPKILFPLKNNPRSHLGLFSYVDNNSAGSRRMRKVH